MSAPAAQELTAEPGPAHGGAAIAAGFWARLGALALDALILAVIDTVAVLLVALISSAAALVVYLLAGLLAIPYFVFFEGGPNGQTIGKRALGIRVVRVDTGDDLGYGRAFLRQLARILSSLPLYLGYLWMLWDGEAQTWHDKIVSTQVVELGRGSPPSEFGFTGSEPVDHSASLLRVTGLVKHFPITRGILFQHKIGAVQAVDGVNFEVGRGETLGIVGETGCGKSTTARLVMRLLESTAGEVRFEGQDITRVKGARLKAVRREMQMIFQDPYSSLNPRKTIGSIISEPFVIHGLLKETDERKKAVQDLMETVGLNPEHYNRYPHEFSGGQRQRIGVARALALKPKLLIADEPVSALDVSIQAQVLNLLRDLQRQFGLTLIFIAHDLSVVRHMCDRVAVMYLGKIVEIGSGDDLYGFPRHPYTGALLSAVPVADPSRHGGQRRLLTGDVPSPANPPKACRFHTRCPKAQERCSVDEPQLEQKGGSGTLTACHFPLSREELPALGLPVPNE